MGGGPAAGPDARGRAGGTRRRRRAQPPGPRAVAAHAVGERLRRVRRRHAEHERRPVHRARVRHRQRRRLPHGHPRRHRDRMARDRRTAALQPGARRQRAPARDAGRTRRDPAAGGAAGPHAAHRARLLRGAAVGGRARGGPPAEGGDRAGARRRAGKLRRRQAAGHRSHRGPRALRRDRGARKRGHGRPRAAARRAFRPDGPARRQAQAPVSRTRRCGRSTPGASTPGSPRRATAIRRSASRRSRATSPRRRSASGMRLRPRRCRWSRRRAATGWRATAATERRRA